MLGINNDCTHTSEINGDHKINVCLGSRVAVHIYVEDQRWLHMFAGDQWWLLIYDRD